MEKVATIKKQGKYWDVLINGFWIETYVWEGGAQALCDRINKALSKGREE